MITSISITTLYLIIKARHKCESLLILILQTYNIQNLQTLINQSIIIQYSIRFNNMIF